MCLPDDDTTTQSVPSQPAPFSATSPAPPGSPTTTHLAILRPRPAGAQGLKGSTSTDGTHLQLTGLDIASLVKNVLDQALGKWPAASGQMANSDYSSPRAWFSLQVEAACRLPLSHKHSEIPSWSMPLWPPIVSQCSL